MDLLGDLTRSDLDADRLYFTKNEVVEFVITDFTVNKEKGTIMIRCVVQTGEHAGKKYTMFVPDASSEMNRKKRAIFFFKSGFWSEAEIESRDIDMKRLISRRFSAKASAVREKDGNRYQDMLEIKDLGNQPLPSTESPAAMAANATKF